MDRERYRRQLIIEGWGEEAQGRIANARVGIAGLGGLGSPVATYLSAAGVGTLVLCDDQVLELSNLNRQVLYETGDIGASKTVRASERLLRLNPDIRVLVREGRIDAGTINGIFEGCDLVIDCLDNWPTRFILNRWCVERSTAFIHGGIRAFWGQTALLAPPRTACLACFLDARHQEGEIPVVGAVAGALGSLMALTALRYLGNIGDAAPGILRFVDFSSWEIESVTVKKREDCPVCGGRTQES